MFDDQANPDTGVANVKRIVTNSAASLRSNKTLQKAYLGMF
jgi:hypothetical protein